MSRASSVPSGENSGCSSSPGSRAGASSSRRGPSSALEAVLHLALAHRPSFRCPTPQTALLLIAGGRDVLDDGHRVAHDLQPVEIESGHKQGSVPDVREMAALADTARGTHLEGQSWERRIGNRLNRKIRRVVAARVVDERCRAVLDHPAAPVAIDASLHHRPSSSTAPASLLRPICGTSGVPGAISGANTIVPSSPRRRRERSCASASVTDAAAVHRHFLQLARWRKTRAIAHQARRTGTKASSVPASGVACN